MGDGVKIMDVILRQRHQLFDNFNIAASELRERK